MKKLLSIVSVVAVSLTAFAGTARADNSFQLHLEPGFAQPLTAPQSDIYQTGMVLGAKGMFAIQPYLTVGPSISAMYLPRAVDNGQNAGTVWQFAGSVRLQTDRRVSNSDPLFHDFNPWIDMDLGAAQTGNLTRPVWDLGVGAEAPLDQNHIVWMGPFLRYTHIFQTSDTQDSYLLDPRDVNVLQAGLSFSFDTPTHRKVVTEQVVVEKEVKAPCPPTQLVMLTLPKRFAITEKVYFDFDRSSLRWESRDKLDSIVARINSHPNVTLRVEGHASSDGNKLHNVKLSGERTAAVVQYLVQHGVNPSRLTGVALGIDHPAAPNTSKEGRERNRRVEFVVTLTSVDNK
jgi:outer membrane protein OmpA-like peptidoglycan-associated protein